MRGWKKMALGGIIFRVIYAYYVLLKHTCRFQIFGFASVQNLINSNQAFVFATPHCSLLPCVLSFDGFKGVFLASLSGDGTLISQLLRLRGFEVIQGSTSRGGVAALFALRKAISKGLPVGITFDGPRGPPFVPKPGVIQLAFSNKSNNCYLVWVKPTGFLGRLLHLKLKSWDKFLLPLPFCSFEAHYELCDLSVGKEAFALWLEARARAVYADH